MRQRGLSQRREPAPRAAAGWVCVALFSLAATLSPASSQPAQPAQPEQPAPDTPGHQADATSTESQDAQAESLPPEAAEEPTSDIEAPDEILEPAKLATIVFTADAPCSLVVNGIAAGSLEPGEPLAVDVTTLQSTVSAASTEVALARWTDEFELEPDETREIAIPILEAIESQWKIERRTLVFRDLDRGLMWTRSDNARDLAWSGATAYCEGLGLGGFDDWALPSLAELETLEAIWSIRPLKVADQVLLTACCLWSSTEGADNTVWNMDFRFRREFEANRNLSFGLRALCLRAMPADELAEAQLAASPKERKRRLKEKRQRKDEAERRKAERAAAKAAKKVDGG